jgi:hypothetical protein
MTDDSPDVAGEDTLEPSADIADAVTSADYSIEAALADLVDNSIDAGATAVLIRVVGSSDRVSHVLIADDGRGMNADQLKTAMSFAKRRNYGASDLGMYGLGLKSASLSQCSTVTVSTQAKNDEPVGRQWTLAKARSGWRCGILSKESAANILAATFTGRARSRKSGTVVRWDGVKIFQKTTETASAAYSAFQKRCADYLGLVFHRFLESGRLSIVIEYLNEGVPNIDEGRPFVGLSKQVAPLNPFAYSQSGDDSFPSIFKFKYGTLSFAAQAHVWPKSTKKDPSYRLIGSIADRQGIYFYRSNRLVQFGGWNGYRSGNEPHGSLARVAIDLPTANVDSLRIRYSKAGVDVPPEFTQALKLAVDQKGRTFPEFVAAAERVYRTRGSQVTPPIHPVQGMSRRALKIGRDAFGVSDTEPFKIMRGRVPIGELFAIDFDRKRLLINQVMLDGASEKGYQSAVKTLVYLLLQQHLGGERINANTKTRLTAFSQMCAAAISEGEQNHD